MNFSKTTSYALTILNCMADHENELFSARALHEMTGIPWQYLRQLLTSLSKDGFIISAQGRSGGFRLSKSPEKITLADIVEAIEGLSLMQACIMGYKECPYEHTCAMHETWELARDEIMVVLKSTNLASFRRSA